MFKMMLIAGAGGFLGTCARFATVRLCAMLYGGLFPLGTFVVNVVGCFLIGLLFGMLERTSLIGAGVSVLLITGFCGGFTTFSSFAGDIVTMGDKGACTASIIYAVASVLVGIAMVWLGRAIMR